MRTLRRTLVPLSLVTALALAPAQATATEGSWQFGEFTVSNDALCEMRDAMTERMLATHEAGTWAPMEYQMTDADLARMGLPSRDVLLSRRYPTPTLVTKDGRFYDVPTSELEAAVQASAQQAGGSSVADGPTVATFAGTGCLGIRPGAWLLLLTGGGIGWCSMAHVYGSPGNYDISTAGHCGKTGDTATVIAALGNRSGVAGAVLLDFGTFGTSKDGGLGNDWALIDIKSAYQGLVTPTMCFWGGPRGMYTKTGGLATVSFKRGLIPSVTVTPDPFLAQAVVHYGHGIGLGPGGTPRAGTSIHWGQTHFMFIGAISFGDSGSGANTLTGDTVGANMEAAGIMTHLYIDPLMRQGIGIMGGTRATAVSGTLANGQIVPYPAPAPGLP
jgi:hypothetical protein